MISFSHLTWKIQRHISKTTILHKTHCKTNSTWLINHSGKKNISLIGLKIKSKLFYTHIVPQETKNVKNFICLCPQLFIDNNKIFHMNVISSIKNWQFMQIIQCKVKNIFKNKKNYKTFQTDTFLSGYSKSYIHFRHIHKHINKIAWTSHWKSSLPIFLLHKRFISFPYISIP